MGRALWTACCCIWVSGLYFGLYRPFHAPEAGANAGHSSSSNSSDLSPTAKLTRPSMPFGAFAFEVHGRVGLSWFQLLHHCRQPSNPAQLNAVLC
jgi:hypothetical protein